ncbi:MAG: SET domain-containing protein-lysine N-methyltransferase [Nitrososphaerales archaeon]|nr:SET domain-containing protein-lysine N-methyltransferase [Nitrososphaerales archaeon]
MIQGFGVFALGDFEAGEQIFDIDDSDVVSDFSKLTRHDYEFELDYLESGKVVRLRPPFRCVNHSCNPNAYVKTIDGQRKALAMREIRVGEEITYDYSTNGYSDGTFECHCGSRNCRKVYHGNFFGLPRATQIRYLPYIEDWFKSEHKEDFESLLGSL